MLYCQTTWQVRAKWFGESDLSMQMIDAIDR